MSTLSDPTSLPSPPVSILENENQQRRKKRLIAIIAHGLPPFPHTVLELTSILSSAAVDVKKAGKVIRADPSLSVQVLRLCNSPMLGLRTRVISIEQATILLGTERLRTLATTCSLVDYSGKGLPPNQVINFWQHSFLTALLSEHLAKESDYCEKEQAYIAGLLHDIGQLPQWMLAVEEKAERQTIPPEGWTDNPSVEREFFGLDHSEIGSSMAVAWNLMPSFTDVLGYHHNPEAAQHDPTLVKIIATIEHFLLTRVSAHPSIGAEGHGYADELEVSVPLQDLQVFAETHPQSVVEMLTEEYDRLVPLVKAGLTSTIGAIV